MKNKNSYNFVSVPKGSGRETPSSPRRKLGSESVSRPLPLNTVLMLIIVYIVLILHSYPRHGGRETPSSPRRKLGSESVSRPLPLNTVLMFIIVYVVSILHSYPRHGGRVQVNSEKCISPIDIRGLTYL